MSQYSKDRGALKYINCYLLHLSLMANHSITSLNWVEIAKYTLFFIHSFLADANKDLMHYY